MIRFDSDYMEGAHPAILSRMTEINLEKNTGYGLDKYTESAKKKIKTACNKDDAEVYFLVGGTQTNACVISAALRTYESVLCVDTGHINTHEAGAIEGTGHKVVTIPQENGKLTAKNLKEYMLSFNEDENKDHVPQPRMVYISNSTENGSIYTKSDLISLRKICDEYSLILYMDGARLGYAMASYENDLSLEDIASLCDAFYIGGTKVGALFGEAVVLCNPNYFGKFFTHIKRQGALLAKGWLAGIQFDTLFTDDLYYKISKNAIEKADELKKALKDKGYKFHMDSPTNQQFVLVDDEELKKFEGKVTYGFWLKPNKTQTVIRFTTSWATTSEQIKELEKVL